MSQYLQPPAATQGPSCLTPPLPSPHAPRESSPWRGAGLAGRGQSQITHIYPGTLAVEVVVVWEEGALRSLAQGRQGPWPAGHAPGAPLSTSTRLRAGEHHRTSHTDKYCRVAWSTFDSFSFAWGQSICFDSTSKFRYNSVWPNVRMNGNNLVHSPSNTGWGVGYRLKP